MDFHGFVAAVLAMRAAQNRYFRSRGNEALQAAISCEREVDLAIETYLKREQAELFDTPRPCPEVQSTPGRDSPGQ